MQTMTEQQQTEWKLGPNPRSPKVVGKYTDTMNTILHDPREGYKIAFGTSKYEADKSQLLVSVDLYADRSRPEMLGFIRSHNMSEDSRAASPPHQDLARVSKILGEKLASVSNNTVTIGTNEWGFQHNDFGGLQWLTFDIAKGVTPTQLEDYLKEALDFTAQEARSVTSERQSSKFAQATQRTVNLEALIEQAPLTRDMLVGDLLELRALLSRSSTPDSRHDLNAAYGEQCVSQVADAMATLEKSYRASR